jgi:hypothetical protein
MGRTIHKPDIPPILLGEVRSLGIMLSFKCTICMHSRMIDPKSLTHDDGVTLHDLAHYARCTPCNRRRGGIGISPDMRPWVRHLRATGQFERVPYVVRGLMWD